MTYIFSVEMKKVRIAGPKMSPQKPKVEIPASIAKKMRSSLMFVGVVTSFSLIHLMMNGLTKVSATSEMTMTE